MLLSNRSIHTMHEPHQADTPACIHLESKFLQSVPLSLK